MDNAVFFFGLIMGYALGIVTCVIGFGVWMWRSFYFLGKRKPWPPQWPPQNKN